MELLAAVRALLHTSCCTPLLQEGIGQAGIGLGAARPPPAGPGSCRSGTSGYWLQSKPCPWCPESWNWPASPSTTSSSAGPVGNPEAMCPPDFGRACAAKDTHTKMPRPAHRVVCLPVCVQARMHLCSPVGRCVQHLHSIPEGLHLLAVHPDTAYCAPSSALRV
eukprot:1157779-Pelagomonas_calceolata.AAC.10